MNNSSHKIWLNNGAGIILLFSIAGALLIWLCTARYGAGLWPDAVKYIAAARSILHGEGLLIHYAIPGPFIAWAPLYPMLLAVISETFHADPFHISNIINAGIFGLIIFTACMIARKQLSFSPAFVCLTAIFVVFSESLFNISLYASSEPLFIFLSLIAILSADSYRKKNDLPSLLFFSAAIGLATLTRYIGVSIIPLGILLIVLSNKGMLKSKIYHLVIYGILSIVPICLWLLRNYIVSGTLMGVRAPSQHTLLQNIYYSFVAIIGCQFPHNIIISLMIIAYISIIVVVFGLKNYKRFHLENFYSFLSQSWVLSVYVASYTLFLLISSTTTAYDTINDRLLSPIYVPSILLILFSVEKMIGPLRNSSSRAFKLIFLSIILLALFEPARIMMKSVQGDIAQGVTGYSDKEWKESPTIHYLLNNTSCEKSVIFSNDPDAIYILTNINARWSPPRNAYMSPQTKYNVFDLKGIWPEQSLALLVWFNNKDRNYLFSPNELMQVSKMEPIAKLADGVIYRISRYGQDEHDVVLLNKQVFLLSL
jgi:hypothetical protein